MIAYPPALRRSGFIGPMDGGQPSHVERPPRRRPVIRLWLPLSIIFLLLGPFVLLLAPLGYLVPARHRVAPFATAFALGRALLSLSGTVVHVEAPDALIHIRVF